MSGAGGQGAAPTPRGLGRKLLAVAVIGVLVFAAMSVYGDVSRLRDNLAAYRASTFAVALALATGNYLIRFARWEYYLRVLGVRVARAESLVVFLAGFIMSITPGKVGEVFKSLLLRESSGVPVARTAPIVVAERLTDLLALVVLAAVGSLSFRQGLPIALAGGAVTLLALVLCAHRPLGRRAIRFAGRLPVVGPHEAKLLEAHDSLQAMLRPAPLLFATAVSIASWFLECLALHVVVRGFRGVELDLVESVFAYSAPTILGAIAFLPGGLGVTEAGMTGVLETLGGDAMTPSVAIAVTMLVRLATLWWAVAIGVIAYAIFRRWMRRRL